MTVDSRVFKLRNDNTIHDMKITEDENQIIIENSHLVMPQFYYVKKGNDFILSTNMKLKEGGRFVFNPPIFIKHSQWGPYTKYAGENRKIWKMIDNDEIPFHYPVPYKIINNYKKITLKRNGDISVEKNDVSRLYSVPIEESFPLIKQWSEKWEDTVADYCRQNKFIPTLTGGCDTRILTYFWRRHNIKQFRLRSVKQDGKNNVEKGRIEIDIAAKVIKKMGLSLERLEEPPKGFITMSGVYTDSTQYQKLLNNKNFVTNVMNRCNTAWYALHPFTDDNYLMIKPRKILEIRCLFLLLFCPDLLDIEMISASGDGVYDMSFFKDVYEDCKELICKMKK